MKLDHHIARVLEDSSFPALDAFNSVLAAARPVHPADAAVFLCSIYCMDRSAPAGIVTLAARLTDALVPVAPFEAHALAAHVLEAAMDEYGLRGGPTHAELLARFGEALGVPRDVLVARAHAPEGARALERGMQTWFRDSPVDFALGVHLASELTSRREFTRWLSTLGDNDHPGWEYLRAHCAVEDDHISGLTTFADAWLRLRPGVEDRVMEGVRAYDAAYARMFREMTAAIVQRRAVV
jgi:hypothetical protein